MDLTYQITSFCQSEAAPIMRMPIEYQKERKETPMH